MPPRTPVTRDRALAEYMGDVHYHIDQVARMNGY